jgi:hypothetical protein
VVFEKIDLSNNQLIGSIPSQLLGQVTLMEEMSLSNNRLIGWISSESSFLAENLGLLNVSMNLLSGIVPQPLCHLNSSFFNFDCSQSFCGCDCPCMN